MVFLFLLSWNKRKRNKKKNSRLNVSGATPERPFWCWKKNSLRFSSLKQHFSAPPVRSSAHAPPPRPIFLDAKALCCWLFVFGFRLVFFAKVLRCWLFAFGFRFACSFRQGTSLLAFCYALIAWKKAPFTRGKRGLDILVSVFTWRNLRHVSLWLL